MESTIITIGTQDLKNHKLFTKWLCMGYVRTTDGFVCLNKVVQQPITKLLCDRYLAAVCIDFTSQLNCSKSKRITNIILRSKTFWLSVLYPNLIQKKEDPYGKDLL